MRGLNSALFAAALCVCGCRRSLPLVDLDESGNQPPASFVRTANPASAPQLLSGFYQIEYGDWRWTARRFAVLLAAPDGAAQRGALLELNLSIPPVVLDRKKAVTVSAWVNSAPLAPECYDRAGTYTYSRRVPPAALSPQPVEVNFALDRYLAAGEIEQRELGVIVRTIALKPD